MRIVKRGIETGIKKKCSYQNNNKTSLFFFNCQQLHLINENIVCKELGT